jgi:hypothetical protein
LRLANYQDTRAAQNLPEHRDSTIRPGTVKQTKCPRSSFWAGEADIRDEAEILKQSGDSTGMIATVRRS